MASVRVQRAEPVTPPITNVTLELSPEEARTLAALLYSGVAGTGDVRALLTVSIGAPLVDAVGRHRLTNIECIDVSGAEVSEGIDPFEW